MALFISWDDVDGVEEDRNTIIIEPCCMKQSFNEFMKKKLNVIVRDDVLYSMCIYHFVLNMLMCLTFIHFRVAGTILQWLFGDRIMMESEFLYVFVIYFCNILLFMQLLDEFGAIIITFFCKCSANN